MSKFLDHRPKGGVGLPFPRIYGQVFLLKIRVHSKGVGPSEVSIVIDSKKDAYDLAILFKHVLTDRVITFFKYISGDLQLSFARGRGTNDGRKKVFLLLRELTQKSSKVAERSG